VVRTSVTHSPNGTATFLLLPHFDVVNNLVLNRRTAIELKFVFSTFLSFSQNNIMYDELALPIDGK